MASPSREISLALLRYLAWLVSLFTSIPTLSFFNLAADLSPSRATYLSSLGLRGGRPVSRQLCRRWTACCCAAGAALLWSLKGILVLSWGKRSSAEIESVHFSNRGDNVCVGHERCWTQARAGADRVLRRQADTSE
jgi:hypothetical protein